jgi:hypothetical protein
MEADELGPFLRAHFNIARQISKPVSADPQEQLVNQAKTIAKYEWLLDFASKQVFLCHYPLFCPLTVAIDSS